MCCSNVCVPAPHLERDDCCCPADVPCDVDLACRQNADCVDTQVCCNSTEKQCGHRVCAQRPVPCDDQVEGEHLGVGQSRA